MVYRYQVGGGKGCVGVDGGVNKGGTRMGQGWEGPHTLCRVSECGAVAVLRSSRLSSPPTASVKLSSTDTSQKQFEQVDQHYKLF